MGLDIAGRYRYPPPRADWLARYTEPVLDPELRIIDAHHHLWDEPANRYLLEEIARDLQDGHRIVATVCVQASYAYRTDGPAELRCVGETLAIEQIAARARSAVDTEVAAAIIAFADLTLGERLESVLEAQLAAAPARLRGIRHSVARDPHFPEGIVVRPAPAELLADPRYRAGLAALVRRGLIYEAMLYHCQIPELTAAARALPDLPIVLDHFGGIVGVGPYVGRERESFDAWRLSMRELASCTNVHVKLGGLGMIICGARWHEAERPPDSAQLAAAWRPYVETCVELFGARRCMFEANFPVDKGMFSYRVAWNAFKRLAAGASSNERAALFHDTAARVYGIGAVAGERAGRAGPTA